MQVPERPDDTVEAACERVRGDPRDKAGKALSPRAVLERGGGACAMAERERGESGGAFVDRVDAMIAGAGANIRATLAGLARLRRAA